MSTISVILEPSPDGTLHLPVPEAWRKLAIRVKAEMEPADTVSTVDYSTEWEAAFGAIDDETFVPPLRNPLRAMEPFDVQ